jgi:hypothetical protein
MSFISKTIFIIACITSIKSYAVPQCPLADELQASLKTIGNDIAQLNALCQNLPDNVASVKETINTKWNLSQNSVPQRN